MKGLLSRIPSRRRSSGAVRADGQTAPIAGVDPAALAAPGKPSFRDRGRLRRRLRYLRRVRELGFRDLGGLVFDQHRFNRPNEELVRSKLGALQAVDGELRALELLLDDRRPVHELREPGIAACLRCGAIHGSDARFCPNCGVPVTGARSIGEVAQAPAATAATAAATTPVGAAAPAAQPVGGATADAVEQPTEIRPSADDDDGSGRFGRLLRRRRPAEGEAPAADENGIDEERAEEPSADAAADVDDPPAAEQPTESLPAAGESPPVSSRDDS